MIEGQIVMEPILDDARRGYRLSDEESVSLEGG
jgi:hypothetical protein